MTEASPGEPQSDRVTVEPALFGWAVWLRRDDGTRLLAGSDGDEGGAEVIATQLRIAIADGDTWALRLLDVSAGFLRSP